MSISQNFPNTRPSLNLNFARSKTLDPRITFTRTSTGTYVDESGVIRTAVADEPRFDHDPVTGESLGLLIEEGRSNIKIRSEELQSDFSRAQITTISQNEIISPDGLQTADGIVPNGTDTAHYLDKVFTSTSGITTSQDICCSAFFKKGVGRNVWLQIYEESGNAYHGVKFDFETETLTFQNSTEYTTGGGVTTGYGVIKYPNGWYRLWVAGYPNTTTTGRRYRISLTDASGVFNFSGDAVSSYVYSWGVQVEIGAFPTSYIPTSGSTATRTADNVSMVGDNFSDWYNQSEGTVFSAFRCDNWNSSNQFGKVFTINQVIFGVEDNGFWIGNDANNSNTVRYRVRSSGVNQFGPANLTRTSTTVKSAMSVKSSDFAITIDGNTPTTSTSGTLPQVMNSLTIGRDIVGIEGAHLNGTISQLTYYPRRLTNTQLQNLTK